MRITYQANPVIGHGELRRGPHTALRFIEIFFPVIDDQLQVGNGIVWLFLNKIHRFILPDSLGKLYRVFLGFRGFLFVKIGKVKQQAAPVVFTEVRTAINGPLIGQAKAIQWPAPPTAH